MIKARVDRLERILGGVVEPWRGTIRIAPFFDNDPIPIAAEGEDLIPIQIVRTPRPPIVPSDGGGVPDEDLQAEVERLEQERDALKARASERETRGHPRRARSIVKNPGEKGGER